MPRALVFLLLLPWKAEIRKCHMKDFLPVPHEFFQPGDLLIGGMTSFIFYDCQFLPFTEHASQNVLEVPHMLTKFYQNILALAFAIREINMNPKILPNVTLGLHICDSYYDNKMTYRTTLQLLYKSHKYFPNYECKIWKNLMAIIGALGLDVSFQMANILSLFKIPQLTYGSFTREWKDTTQSALFYSMVPDESQQLMGLVQLLQHFQWTWVGLFIVEDESGEHFLHVLEPLLSQNDICLAFTQRLKNEAPWNSPIDALNLASKAFLPLSESKANTCIVYGESGAIISLTVYLALTDSEYEENESLRKVWITTAQSDFAMSGIQWGWDFRFFHGTISFTVHSMELPGFQTFLRDIKPDWTKGDGFFKDFWEQAFVCSFPDPREEMGTYKACTGEERLENLPGPVFEMPMTGHSYSIYNAAYAIAHALHALNIAQSKHRLLVGGERVDLQDIQPWQQHVFLRGISFNNSAGETVSFNGKNEIRAGFDITNLVTSPNRSFHRVKVGKVNPNALEERELILHEDTIVWQTIFSQVPISVCTEHCHPGYQRQMKEGEKFCCYDCIPCPEGKISSQKDVDDCIKCPEDQYPNKAHNQCFPKVISFLSFEEPLGITLTSLAIFHVLITSLVLWTFIRHRDTPIAKANNRNITYSLLSSLLLCFLSSLLFLGRPRAVTCFLQQAAFGIIFTMAVSCILAKTVTVMVAFMATKPGSKGRKWVGKRLASSIVFPCSIIQVCICTVWLGMTPPSLVLNTKSMTEEIIIECSEGSLMFYTVLGYVGLLSFVSLAAAFLARKLPDTFNEAKFITFSMLIFCCVWMSFVPTSLSTKGKYTVAVEAFSILVSAAGLLGCIFFPKCYLIVLRPELNKREHLTRKK